MSEEAKKEETVISQESQQVNNPFDDSAWVEGSGIKEEAKKEEVKAEPPKQEEKKEEEKVDDNPLKTHLGYESWDKAKEEIETLRKKSATASEINFENEDSRKFFELIKSGKKSELYQALNQEMEIEQAEALDVTDAKKATELLRIHFKYKYKDLTPGEISDMIEDTYVKPEKPENNGIESDDEYNARVEKWKQQCEAVDRRIIRDAKLAKPEFSQYKSKIVLPEIPQENRQPEQKKLTQEELDTIVKERTDFLKSAETSVTNFAGFKVQVKNKDVDYSVSYVPSKEEKDFVSAKIKLFTESNFDANAALAEKWVNKDGVINVDEMSKDLLLIYGGADRAAQKIANDAAEKRLELFLKEKKNINVDETSQNGKFNPEKDGKTEMQNVQEYFWNQS